jgi:hypothetical protein
MKKISYNELYNAMCDYNRKNPAKEDDPMISGVIVYKQSNWEKDYSEKSRSYRVYNSNRAFQDGKIANSIFGYCLDGTDQGVRLDWYKWEPEFCYME